MSPNFLETSMATAKPCLYPTIHSFTPTYIHPAFRLQTWWTRRLRTLGKPHSVQSALDFLVGIEAAHEPRAMSLRELARRSAIPLSTCRRALGDLVGLGWVIQDAEGIRIRLHQAAAPRTKTAHPPKREKAPQSKASSGIPDVPPFKEQIPEGDIPSGYLHGDTAPKAPRPPAASCQGLKERKPKLTAEEQASRAAVKGLLEEAGASPEGVAKVLWNAGKVWSSWDRVAKVVKAALDVANERGEAVYHRGRFLVAAALRPSLGRSLEQSARKRDHGRKDPQAPAEAGGLLDAWRAIQAAKPGADSPGYLDHLGQERAARRALVQLLSKQADASWLESLVGQIKAKLAGSGLDPAGPVWTRAMEHHRSAAVLAQAGIQEELPAKPSSTWPQSNQSARSM